MMSEKWTVPKWLEQYKDHLTVQGSADKWKEYVEDMMNDGTPVQINAPRAIYSTITQSEVGLLARLRKAGVVD